MRKRKLIDKIEHKGKQIWRWLRVIFIILLIFWLFLLLIYHSKETKEADKNLEKSLLLNKDCLINVGKELCIQKGTTLKQVYIDEFKYIGTFSCFNIPRINITSNQLEECSNGKK